MPTDGNKENRRTYMGEQGIDSLISAPLMAASKANAMMLIGQARFLLENCFTVGADGRREPVMIEMVIQSGSLKTDGQNGSYFIASSELTFQVPLISLLPFNNLGVEQIKMDFGLNITSMRRGHTREEHARHGKLSGVLKSDTILNGRISSHDRNGKGKRKRDYDHEAHLRVSIEMKSFPLPKGTQTLLDLYDRAIAPTQK